MRGVLAAVVAMGLCLAGSDAAGSWHIVKESWSAADEDGFSRFVEAIGLSGCSSAQSCLRDPANPFRASDTRFVDIDADCAKWPYLLRGYYAWKNGLPFSYVDAVSGQGDLRYSRRGNRPVGRRDLVDRGTGIDGPRALRQMLDEVNSSVYRVDAQLTKGPLPDFYSPAIQPGSIRPGTVIYDINGHVGIVYKVEADGRIRYMDAHPDFTISRSVYGAQFGKSPMRLGGGLKNWRPLLLVGAKSVDGRFVGGRIKPLEDASIADFSLAQYLGTEADVKNPDEKAARFVYDGEEMGFYAYVRTAVSGGRTDYNPVFELRHQMRTLCRDLRDRARAIDLAISKSIDRRPHPARLPDNIYGTDDAEWELYATPSRDVRLKAGFVQFHQDMTRMIAMWVDRDPRLNYDGLDLKADLMRAYEAESNACTITYLDSAKHPVKMTFDDMAHRLFAMSFDPFHCVELRWGASGDGRKSCVGGEYKLKWYYAEQSLRNQMDRTYDARMEFDLDALVRRGVGRESPPIDIMALIEAIPAQNALSPMVPVGR